MEKNINNELTANINSAILLGFLCLYVFRRAHKSHVPSINIFSGQLKTLGIWLAKFSILSMAIFSAAIALISTKYEIKKITYELTRIFNSAYIVSVQGYQIDMAIIMGYSLKFAETFLISSLFLLAALWEPESPSARASYRKGSISVFCKIWAILRIPAVFYFDMQKALVDRKIVLFVSLVSSTIELTMVSFFFIIQKSKMSADTRNNSTKTNINMFAMVILFYGIFKHAINIIDLPFILNEVHTQVLSSVQTGLLMAIYVFMITLYCPTTKYILENDGYSEESKKYTRDAASEDTVQEVALLAPYIELEEQK
ncbi:hypothetical protein ENBRE01_0362 [Enteropsectra breve]|nr:hypothetical protein ENBRE01_0362 [Enteropsectra breve]